MMHAVNRSVALAILTILACTRNHGHAFSLFTPHHRPPVSSTATTLSTVTPKAKPSKTIMPPLAIGFFDDLFDNLNPNNNNKNNNSDKSGSTKKTPTVTVPPNFQIPTPSHSPTHPPSPPHSNPPSHSSSASPPPHSSWAGKSTHSMHRKTMENTHFP